MKPKIKLLNLKKLSWLSLVIAVILLGAVLNLTDSALAENKVDEGRIKEETFSESRLFFGSLFNLGKNEVLNLKENSEGLYEEEKVYTSKEFKTDFEFNGLGLKWQGEIPENTKVDFEARVLKDKDWTDWIGLSFSGGEVKDGDSSYQNYTQPIFVSKGQKIQYRVRLATFDNKVSPLISSVEIIYINTEESLREKISGFLNHQLNNIAKAVSRVTVISRKDWKADESYRFNARDKEIWEPEYKTVKKFIIHHTAGSDGGDNPKSTVRGIYYWHAVVLGWGDVGYNYLIDREGNIYEGRYGGDGIVGGHTYNDLTDINYNEGSMGIAILGCFEEAKNKNGKGVCPDQDVLAKKVRGSLTNLLAKKAQTLKIEPAANSKFFGENTPNIIGHRDVDQTYCPGSNIHNQLATIRKETQTKVDNLGGIVLDYEAKISRYEILPATFLGDTQEVTIVYRNIGVKTWQRKNSYLNIYDLGREINRYYSEDWPDNFGNIKFREWKVEPNELATFSFTFNSPSRPGLFKSIFELNSSGKVIENSELDLTTLVDAHYKAEIVSHNIPLAVLNIWRYPVEIKFKNTGMATWNQGMVLNIYDLGEKTSRFRDYSWGSSSGNITLKESQVKPGEIGTFTFRQKAPSNPGQYLQKFKLEIKGRDVYVDNGEVTLVTRVDSAKKK